MAATGGEGFGRLRCNRPGMTSSTGVRAMLSRVDTYVLAASRQKFPGRSAERRRWTLAVHNVLPVALKLFQNAHCERGHGVCMPGSTLYAPYEETHFSYCVSYGCRCTP